MEVINKPSFSILNQNVAFFRADKRKWFCLGLVLMVPLMYNSWRFFPSDLEIEFYSDFSTFWWALSVNMICPITAIAWMLTIPRKDYVMRMIVSSLLIYGVYMTYAALPIIENTPLLIDLIAIFGTYLVLYSCITLFQKKYLEKRKFDESLHINLLHDLNHHRFMGAVCRIEGMVKVSEMEDYYHDSCLREIEELKETFAYITEKYESLH